MGLAMAWSSAQLLRPILPIRLHMSTSSRVVFVPAIAVSLAMVAPTAVAGQTLNARPASVSLTVVVPPRPESRVVTGDRAIVIGQTASALDFQTVIGVADHRASRIEVRLGAGWTSDSARVLVQNAFGEFERLGANTSVIAVGTSSPSDARSVLRFRLERDHPVAMAAVAIPVEYRITVGQSDQIAIWSFPSLIQLTAAR